MMPSNTNILLTSDNTAAFLMEFIGDPQALLAEIKCFLRTDNDLERNCHSLNHGNNTQ